ncbi:secondary thiamine-phosphate synthase enzyme YjbQ [Patescibacteria group bacterium]|nr:secondary thiamine-phosphate synthase enzyme YjbQ [Patescibacteria group bacterium]MCL5091369.1 secondary thiamine-phosphate synthase enzyme YjbQ [Patescibacteria group bacterium]
MKIINRQITIKTQQFLEFIDLTEMVELMVKRTKISDGQALIYSRHTTVAVRINEQESGLFGDFRDLVARLIPREIYYRHNDLGIRTENLSCAVGASDCLNGHSHCLHLLMGTSETVPIVNGQLMLGRYQRIFMVELDVARQRQILIQIMGK